MDERIEHGDDTSSAVARSAFGRREMLQRTGFVVGAAALWATPVVQTIGMRPAAATPATSDFCPEGTQSGRPEYLVWRYVGGGCDSTLNSQGPDFFSCTGTANLPCVDIEVSQTGIAGGGGSVAKLWGVGISPDGSDLKQLGDANDQVGTNTTFRIFKAGTAELLQTVEMHTSCSAPLNIGEQFGSMLLVGGKDDDGNEEGETGGVPFKPGENVTVGDCPL